MKNGEPMSIAGESVTFNLPSDASYSTGYDNFGNPYYIITTSKINAPQLAYYALENLNINDQKNIPQDLKKQIIEKTGVKYVFTLPSALRWAAIGMASGIALKTLSNQELSPTIQSVLSKAKEIITYSIPFSGWTIVPAFEKGAEAIQNNPYIAATVITGGSIATSFVSESVSNLASDAAGSILNMALKVADLSMEALEGTRNFCFEYPKTAASVATLGIGFFFRNAT